MFWSRWSCGWRCAANPVMPCQAASDMDRFPFHSISSPHLLRAQQLVYPPKWQCAVLADILTKINLQKCLFIRSCCLSFNKTLLFVQYTLNGNVWSEWKGLVFVWGKKKNHLLPKQELVCFVLISFNSSLINWNSKNRWGCAHLHWCRVTDKLKVKKEMGQKHRISL